MNIHELETLIDLKKEDEVTSEIIFKTALYVIHSLEELIDMKLVKGRKILTQKGQKIAKKLKENGWEPDPDHIIAVLGAIQSGGLYPDDTSDNGK